MKLFESIAEIVFCRSEPTPACSHPSEGGDLKKIKDNSLCSPPWRGPRSGGWVRRWQKNTFASSSFRKGFCSLHPGKPILPLAIVLALLIFLPFAPSSGKVFWSRLLAKGASIFDPAGNWTQIYKSSMTVNGARAFLSVYGCDDPLQSVTAKLKRSFISNKENHFIENIENENSAWILSSAHNQISRLLMLAMPNSDKSVIFELVRQPGDLSKPPALPSESVVFGRSLPAESRLTAIIKNEETGATLETLMTGLPPELVSNELSEHLSRNGWKNISPSAADDASPRYFQIYQRKEVLCAIMIGHALRENKTCVTILLKEINRQNR